ncbi:hypothetical protein EOS_35625 [Caballeronia mineralivorans PML1(12)]|uniref:Uncharacterized protein n=1 Tax=Caballeronia mineralivorans PML1(12) TaxID=908627 RepID=A0A0J1CLA1_9BURK|nr:hypothetical protein [Caballeronia mineralivorans]KLU21502.1 hypothetical protein EOS_35625 [Caballeronia mineralivorans PML1(12)]
MTSSFYVTGKQPEAGTPLSDVQEVIHTPITLNCDASVAEVAAKLASRFGSTGTVKLTIDGEPLKSTVGLFGGGETEGFAMLDEIVKALTVSFSKGNDPFAARASALTFVSYLVDSNFQEISKKVVDTALKAEKFGAEKENVSKSPGMPGNAADATFEVDEDEPEGTSSPVSAINISLEHGGARIHERTRLDGGIEAELVILFALKKAGSVFTKAMQACSWRFGRSYMTTVNVGHVNYSSSNENIKIALSKNELTWWNRLENFLRRYFSDKEGTVFVEGAPSADVALERSRPELPDDFSDDKGDNQKIIPVSARKFDNKIVNGQVLFSRKDQELYVPGKIREQIGDFYKNVKNFVPYPIMLTNGELIDVTGVSMNERSREIPDTQMDQQLAATNSTDDLWHELYKDLKRHMLRDPNYLLIDGNNLFSDNAELQDIIESYGRYRKASNKEKEVALAAFRVDMRAYAEKNDEGIPDDANSEELNSYLETCISKQAEKVRGVLEATFEDEQLLRSMMTVLMQISISGIAGQLTEYTGGIPVPKDRDSAAVNYVVETEQSESEEPSAIIKMRYAYNGVKALVVDEKDPIEKDESVQRVIDLEEPSDMSFEAIFDATPDGVRVRQSSYSVHLVPSVF